MWSERAKKYLSNDICYDGIYVMSIFAENGVKSRENVLFSFTFQNSGAITH